MVAYSVAETGADALTRAIAHRHAAMGIRRNAILPGLINTPVISGLSEAYDEGDTRA
ncbi:MAG: SDR family oxidoreductase [Burkholderiaceae bacterium]|nr:SDR family oxidoreductase [Burkholderiaceae bacterium]